MIYVQSVWDALYHPVHSAFLNGREIVRMRRSASSTVRAIADVIGEETENRQSECELEWEARIERLRRTMLRSRERMVIADYGARSPLKQLSAGAMYKGRIVKRTMGEVCRSSSKSRKWSVMLFRLVRALQPRRCLELGTCLGISGAYIGAAMTVNGSGTLVTIEGAEALAVRARENFRDLGLTNIDCITGRFQDTLCSVVEKAGSLDAVFIDGHHDGTAMLQYVETIVPSLAPGAVLVVDDIGWSRQMHDAWLRLQTRNGVCGAIDLFDVGVCCFGTSAQERFRVAV